ncbi:MAG: hypothetical protein SF029_16165 [bacterium]|nr:hypothetical protein [bacterium]
MSADFKSHVLLRDEKGFMGIPFKRLLLAGTSGGMVYAISRFAAPDIAVPAGAIFGLALLIFTGTRGGLPLWQRWMYRLRGMVLLLAAHDEASLVARTARALELPVDVVRLDAFEVFAPPLGALEIDVREWVTFAHAEEADRDDGLIFLDTPLEVQPLEVQR